MLGKSLAHHAIIALSPLVHDAIPVMVPEMLELSFLEKLELALIQHVFILLKGHRDQIATKVGGAQVDPYSPNSKHIVDQSYVAQNIFNVVVLKKANYTVPLLLMRPVQLREGPPSKRIKIGVIFDLKGDLYFPIRRIIFEVIGKVVNKWIDAAPLLTPVQEILCANVVLCVCLMTLEEEVDSLVFESLLEIIENPAHSTTHYQSLHSLPFLTILTLVYDILPVLLAQVDGFVDVVYLGFGTPLAGDVVEHIGDMAGVLMSVSVSNRMPCGDMILAGVLVSFGCEYFVGLKKYLDKFKVETTSFDHVVLSVPQFWIELDNGGGQSVDG